MMRRRRSIAVCRHQRMHRRQTTHLPPPDTTALGDSINPHAATAHTSDRSQWQCTHQNPIAHLCHCPPLSSPSVCVSALTPHCPSSLLRSLLSPLPLVQIDKNCERLRFLLTAAKLPFTEVDISLQENEAAKEYMKAHSQAELRGQPKKDTIPQVFLNGTYKGVSKGKGERDREREGMREREGEDRDEDRRERVTGAEADGV